MHFVRKWAERNIVQPVVCCIPIILGTLNPLGDTELHNRYAGAILLSTKPCAQRFLILKCSERQQIRGWWPDH